MALGIVAANKGAGTDFRETAESANPPNPPDDALATSTYSRLLTSPVDLLTLCILPLHASPSTTWKVSHRSTDPLNLNLWLHSRILAVFGNPSFMMSTDPSSIPEFWSTAYGTDIVHYRTLTAEGAHYCPSVWLQSCDYAPKFDALDVQHCAVNIAQYIMLYKMQSTLCAHRLFTEVMYQIRTFMTHA